MNHIAKLPSFLLSLLGVFISLGVTVHDGHMASAIGVGSSSNPTTSKVAATDLLREVEARSRHTHSESDPTSEMLTNSFRYQSPSISPDRKNHHKNIQSQLEEGGRHAFDNTNLPIID